MDGLFAAISATTQLPHVELDFGVEAVLEWPKDLRAGPNADKARAFLRNIPTRWIRVLRDMNGRSRLKWLVADLPPGMEIDHRWQRAIAHTHDARGSR